MGGHVEACTVFQQVSHVSISDLTVWQQCVPQSRLRLKDPSHSAPVEIEPWGGICGMLKTSLATKMPWTPSGKHHDSSPIDRARFVNVRALTRTRCLWFRGRSHSFPARIKRLPLFNEGANLWGKTLIIRGPPFPPAVPASLSHYLGSEKKSRVL